MHQLSSKVPSISSLFIGIFDDWISMKEIQMEDLGKDKKTVTESSAKRGGGMLTNLMKTSTFQFKLNIR